VLGALTMLHLSLLPMKSHNQTETAVLSVLLYSLLSHNQITVLYFKEYIKTKMTNSTLAKTL